MVHAVLSRKAVLRAAVAVVLLMTTVSPSAFAAKASDPEPSYYCFAFLGRVICVPV